MSSSNASSVVTISPPSYSVRELPNGKLYNETLQLSWPSRPKEGYFSEAEYYQRKELVKKLEQEKMNNLFKESTESPESCRSFFPPDFPQDNTAKSAKWFLGTLSPLAAAEKVKNGHMAVFCPLAEPEISDVSMLRKTILLFKNQSGQVYLFPLSHDDTNGLWQLSFFTYRTPTFSRLKELFDYLSTIGNIDPSNGRIEHLPYWIVNEAMAV